VVALLVAATGCITSASVTSGVLTIVGSGNADTIQLRLRSGDPTILDVDDGADGTVEHSFDRATFTAVVVEGGGGADVLSVSNANGSFTDETVTLRGGDGADTLTGGTGSDTLDGGPGADVLDGNTGSDLLLGGTDDDQFGWDPGDSSDTLDAGTGHDRLRFTASNAAEQIGLTDVADHVRLTRDVGGVVLDLDGLEALDLSLLGGADVLTVADLQGTDLTTLDADLALNGSGDGQVDVIAVPPATTIGRDAATTVIDGLGAQVRVRNGSAGDRIAVTGTAGSDVVVFEGSPSTDLVSAVAGGTDVVVDGITPGLTVSLTAVEALGIDLGAGDDTFTATGNLAPLTTFWVAGGAGNDTLSGSNGGDLLDGGPGADRLDGNQGVDAIDGGDDGDVISWDPGDASDTVDGGAGTDRVAFNASNAAETIVLSGSAGHVVLTRDIGSITLDITDIETAEVNTLGGIDQVTVNDLSGTALATVEVDLAATSGGTAPDGAADRIAVSTTPNPEDIEVVGIGPAVEVWGLAAVVRATAADVGVDRLAVVGIGVDDTFSASPAAGDLVVIELVA
jgi:Ca2+-binding RTX toxin-like protein